MIYLTDIIEAYHIARSNKRRTADQTDFELHWEAGCLHLYQDIINHRLRPTAYSFIATRPKPREVFASDMATRVLHHYLDIRLRPILEQLMGDHTFNNRKGMGQNACQNAVISDIYEMSDGYKRDAYIIKLDIKGFFPNLSQDIVYNQLRHIVEEYYCGRDKDELLYILQVCVYSYPTLHCENYSAPFQRADIEKGKSLFDKPLGIGGAIGHLIWQNAANWYLHDIDEWLDTIPCVLHERYVDDIYLVMQDKRYLGYIVPKLREMLAGLGLKLNERKFYCQHWSKGVECLGVHIKGRNVYLNNRVINNARCAVRHIGRPSGGRIERTLSSLNSYFGGLKRLNGYKRAQELVAAIPQGWWQYLYYDNKVMTLKARQSRRERIVYKYNLH